MKKIKSATALVLAVCFLSPALLFACKDTNNGGSVNDSYESVETEENLPPSSSILPDEEISPPPDTPSAPTTPEAPTLPEEPVSPPTLQPETPSTPQPQTKAQYITCVADRVNLRAGAGTSYSVLGSAEEGTVYAVIGKTGNWYKTYYKNQTAYFYASYASVFTLQKTTNEIESVVEEGYKLLGVPYVYGAVRLHDGNGKLLGGFTAQKFDCSSLIQYIFYKGAGELLGVHTRAQVLQGDFVPKSELQRGDCIFFTNEQRKNNKGIERVGHVALYLGDGYILHTASDYARIEKISAKRWSFYIEARRFL